jgi:hypothetical protein
MSTSTDAFEHSPKRLRSSAKLAASEAERVSGCQAAALTARRCDTRAADCHGKRGLLGVGEIAGDRLETIEDRIEGHPHPTDREVPSKHRSSDAKAFDANQRDLAQAFRRRTRIVSGQR